MAKKIIPVPGEGLQFIFDNTGLVHMKTSVATYNDLPITGNTENDLRITRDTDRMYTWTIASTSGTLNDWLDIGPITSVDWSAITNKPTSSVADIDDAVAKKHTQNTDTGTTSDTFAIDSDASGFDPVKIKNESGIMSARNNTDNDYVVMRADDPVNDNDLITKNWAESMFAGAADIIKNSDNIMLNAFRIAINGALTIFNMIDGFVDEYEDESGIDTVNSINELYNSTDDYYAPTTNGLDAFVKLLVHFDGADGSTTFTDVSDSAHVLTAQGNAEVDTAQKKFGTGSGLFDAATTDYISTPDSDDWALDGDFTIDCWMRFSSVVVNQYICEQYVNDSNQFRVMWGSAGNLSMDCNVAGSSAGRSVGFSWSPSVDTWYHLAVVKHNGSVEMYVDGSALTLSGGSKTFGTIPNIAAPFHLCRSQRSGSTTTGWMDEFRLSKGIARWTSNFTPPTSAYSSLADAMDLISESEVAEAEPNNARIVILEEDVDAITLNTDLKAYASKDDGNTWAQITLEDEGNYDASKRILVGNADLDTSGIGSGTDMAYKLVTANGKNLNIHGTALRWD